MDTFKIILQQSQQELKTLLLETVLPQFYDKEDIIYKDGYICANGDEDIMLLAHMDTVFNTPPSLIIHDSQQNIVTSPQGLGGDDRCGVFSIIALLKAGYKPYILFTEDEEIGGVGANKAANNLEIPDNIKYLVQLDRRGQKDAVFYCCDNDDFKEFVSDYGFDISRGSFTDIDTLMPAWDICGVNLSIGYYNEHNKNEYVKINEMVETTLKVAKMIETLPESKHEFIESESITVIDNSYWEEMYRRNYPSIYDGKVSKDTCSVCGETYEDDSIYEIYGMEICEECVQILNTQEMEKEMVHAQ